ncbi:tRNA(Ile)-lysidine synthetase [Novosphingobium sp. AAP83]|uniref:tRNA lysidine(34) synthetase TilS n=1 Tax=Novosphingobium sp. AAP83 TaxID=1523425 RepID=UPI0006B900A7|nr:tRNA lysidine(34) synthetase TilS [Novosphingobium sp. AAP83]KPF92453.1 tRNA(Ile)-lysidine synthetase [Novosphingobium sp. AAP83]
MGAPIGKAAHRLNPAVAVRFAASWSAIAPPGKVGLAVSGGPDSLALLLLACEVAPRNFCVVTVDHGLRPESADEATMVAQLCAERGIAHTTLTLSLAKGSAVQERARHARYEAMGRWARDLGLAALVTAHHADDQAETMVMRLNRGAGLRGLAAMRPHTILEYPQNATTILLRPLLQWSRAELVELVDNAGLIAASDPSNHDQHYERVRIRAAMTSVQAFESKGFAAAANHLAEADLALDWSAAQLWSQVIEHAEGFTWNAPADLPKTLSLRVLERVLTAFEAPPPRGQELVRWLETLRSGGVSTLGGVKGDARGIGAGGPWRFTRAPSPRTRPQ